MAEEKNDKQLMFNDTSGFWRIYYNLETNIAFYWMIGDLVNAYENIRHFYRFISAHLSKLKVNDKNSEDYFKEKFKTIEDFLYATVNKSPSILGRARKISNHRGAYAIMDEVYINLKKLAKEANLELYYGIPKDVMMQERQAANIRKIFGK